MKMTKRLMCSVLLMLFALSFTLAGCSSSPATTTLPTPQSSPQKEPEEVILNLGHVQSPEENVATVFAVAFKEACAKRGITVNIFPASQLGNSRDLLEGMRMGSIDLNVTGTSVVSPLCKEMGVLDLAYIWKDYEHMYKVLDGEIGQALSKKLLEDSGIRTLALSASFGSRCVATVDKVFTNIDEAKKVKLKIRTIESPVYIGSMQAMGFNPTPMGFGEVYTSLQTNVIDGYEHDADTTLANGFNQVANNFMLTNHMNGPIGLFMSEKTWNKLTPEQQKDVSDAAKEAEAIHRKTAPEKEKQKIEKLKETGMNIVEVDIKGFTDSCNEFNKKFCQQNDLIEYYDKIVE